MSHLFFTFTFTFSFVVLIIGCGSVVAAESDSHRLGVAANYGYNFDGDMYDDSQSLHLFYQYNRVQLNLGAKHYQLDSKSETIPDLSLLYSIHDGDLLDLKLGVGLEDKYPTVEYIVEYSINNHFGATIALNQTLNEDFGQNQREAVVGLSYYFYDSNRAHKPAVTEHRANFIQPTDVKLSPEIEAQSALQVEEKSETKLINTTDVAKKPNLPYVVQEGDWLHKLRRKFGFDLDEIIEKNNIENPDLIFPGQVLE
ncbi:LysM peptidoglycan-binding domain-containing protein [Vibrio vulnificus]|uniref:LysM peptidoglycan-binding domain-containing protein n=1 Tax=Vibrio vulnificus TaxID=672 RepID=UPI00405933C6